MSDLVGLTPGLVMDALRLLGWKFVQSGEDEIDVLFQAEGKPTVSIGLKVVGTRLVATSAVDKPIARDSWGAMLVDINEFNAKNYRPKVFLGIEPSSDQGLLIGEELSELPRGTTSEDLGEWIAAHAGAYARCVRMLLEVELG